MAQEVVNTDEVLVGEEIEHVRLITLNRPRQLNVISSKVVSLLAEYLEKWEKDDNAELVIIKGSGQAFSAGGDLKMFYDGRKSKDSCLEVVYRMYWLCYHNLTYKKTQVALVHGISMGGGGSLMVPMKFSVVTAKTNAGEFLALTGARLNGIPPKQATEKDCSGTPLTRDSANIRIVANKSVEVFLPVENFTPTRSLFRSVLIIGFGIKGIRALTIDKDNAPKWNPPSLDNVGDEKVDLVFQPFAADLELEIKEDEANRWDGKYENSAYASFKVTE